MSLTDHIQTAVKLEGTLCRTLCEDQFCKRHEHLAFIFSGEIFLYVIGAILSCFSNPGIYFFIEIDDKMMKPNAVVRFADDGWYYR